MAELISIRASSPKPDQRVPRSHRATGTKADDLPLPLDPDEELRATGEAVLLTGLRGRLDFGFLWPSYQQVRIWITNKRLIEVATPFRGKAAGRRIRSFRWSDVRTAQVSRRDLKIEFADRSKHRWCIVEEHRLTEIRDAVEADRPVLVEQPGIPNSCLPDTLCPNCYCVALPATGECDACGVQFVTPREAGWLAMLLPGGGHLATGHPFVGAARALIELMVFGVLWTIPSDQEWRLLDLPMAVVVLVVLVVFKLEAVMTARGFARMVVPWSHHARQWWRKASFIGGVMMVGWCVSAVLMAGQTSLEVRQDLEFHDADALGWNAAYEPADESENIGSIFRSEWTHDDGWVLEIYAEPLAAFQSPEEWIDEQIEFRSEAGWLAGEPFTTGAVDGIRFLQSEGSGSGDYAVLEYAIFDRVHRDVHLVVCDTTLSQVEDVDARVFSLLRRAHWIKAGDPCRHAWIPG